MITDFSNISAYSEEQFLPALKRVLQDENFRLLVQDVCHRQLHDQLSADDIIAMLSQVRNQSELDDVFVIKGLKNLVAMVCNGFSLNGNENVSPAALYISNHRDIILDAAFLSILIKDLTGERIFFGAGTNLYVQPWVEDMMKLNNAFSVIRGGTPHQMLENSGKLSAYIRHLLCDCHSSVWIAQREGRAKNADDRTQPALLKMLAIAGDGDFMQKIEALNITPLSISYEYDPCDYLKACEMQLKRDNPEWKKTPQDDYISMYTGFLGYKGQTVFTVTPTVNSQLDKIRNKTSIRNEQVNLLAELIDRQIHANYVIYNVNRIAYDLYSGQERFADIYSVQEKEDFVKYIESRIRMIQIPNPDHDFLFTRLLEMYANPLINHLNSLQ